MLPSTIISGNIGLDSWPHLPYFGSPVIPSWLIKLKKVPSLWASSMNSFRGSPKLSSAMRDNALWMQSNRHVREHCFHTPTVQGSLACNILSNVRCPNHDCGLSNHTGPKWKPSREYKSARTSLTRTAPPTLCKLSVQHYEITLATARTLATQ